MARRYGVHKNVAGCVFWICAWILAVLTIPIVAGVYDLFDLGRVPSAAQVVIFLWQGFICGVAYCVLAFVHRARIS
jgi:hypothetical protein